MGEIQNILNILYIIRRIIMPEIKYEVINTIGVVSEGKNGWNKELNLIKWNDREPVYDIRTWSPDHEKIGKGVTISVEEAKVLRDMLNSLDLG